MSHESAELSAALDRFSRKADALMRADGGDTNNTASLTVNAGGVGVWIATTAALIMLACNVFLAVIVVLNSIEISDLNDKLSAIYMMAPHLNPANK